MANVKIARFEWDDENDDLASVDFEIGQSRFRFWRVRRYDGENGIRHYVNPPARKVGDAYVDTVEFPATLRGEVEASALDAFEDARRRRSALNAIRDTEGRSRGTT